MADSQII